MKDDMRDDISKLCFFLEQSEKIISDLVEKPDGFVLKEFVTDQQYRHFLIVAWKEVRAVIVDEKKTLQESSKDCWIKLQKCGLTGNQLALKIETFNKFLSHFEKTREQRFLRRLLGIINSIYGSLSSVLPPLEIAKEFKDVIEQITKIRNNRMSKRFE